MHVETLGHKASTQASSLSPCDGHAATPRSRRGRAVHSSAFRQGVANTGDVASIITISPQLHVTCLEASEPFSNWYKSTVWTASALGGARAPLLG